MRIPFIDSQTRVAQANNCMYWLMEYQRLDCKMPTTSESTNHQQSTTSSQPATSDPSNGRVYSYPVKKWYKHRRLDPSHLLRHYHSHHHHHLYNMHHNHHNHHSSSASMSGAAGTLTSGNSSSGAHHISQSQHNSDSNHAHFANENSNSMDASNLAAASSSTGNGAQHANAGLKEENSTSGAGNETASGDHRHHMSATPSNAISYIEDSFENYESFNEPEIDSDNDVYEDSGKKKKKKVKELISLLLFSHQN